MKKIIQLTIYLGIIMLFLNNTVRAQPIIQNGTSTNYYGETNSTPVSQNDWVRRLGVGSFSLNFDEPHAFFHINSNYLLLPANGSITNFGEVFRTQSPTTLIQAWRMFTGGGSGTQIFNIKNDNTTGSNSISLETFQNDGAIIFNTSPNTERMRIYESTFSNTIGTADPGMVRVGFSSASTNPNGFGPLVHIPKLLVVGSEQNIVSAFADYTVAEFRSEFNESSSVGIKIRGSRYLLSNLCTAHLDFSNYDKDESGGSEYILARLCADMQSDAGELGYFHINTRDGVGVFNSKLLIDNIGFTGIGTTFFMSGAGVFNGPQRRLHVYDAADVPQFRISQAYDVTSSSAGVFTDFQVTSQGNLNMRGFSTGAAIANGQPYAGTVNDGRTSFNLSLATQPQNTVEINSGVTDVG
ncbi:MAG: hypothetical protein LH473_02780, partial [Chitinophagales bacterium]|nr:hypothetical protein [Chitinophagales bacterium]